MWAIAVTKRLLVILEALTIWSSSRPDHEGGHAESKDSQGRVGRGSGTSDRDYEGPGGRSSSQSASALLADRRLCVEVSSTVKLFISKFAFIREAFSFRASDLSPPKGTDRAYRGDNTWDRRDGRDLFGRKDVGGAGVTVESSSVISSRILLLRVLRPTTSSNTTSSSSVRSTSSAFSASYADKQVNYHSYCLTALYVSIILIFTTPSVLYSVLISVLPYHMMCS